MLGIFYTANFYPLLKEKASAPPSWSRRLSITLKDIRYCG